MQAFGTVFPLTATTNGVVSFAHALKVNGDDQAGKTEQVMMPSAPWCSLRTSCYDSALDSSFAQVVGQSSCNSAVATAETSAAKECSVTWLTVRYDLADSCEKVICDGESCSYLECERAAEAG